MQGCPPTPTRPQNVAVRASSRDFSPGSGPKRLLLPRGPFSVTLCPACNDPVQWPHGHVPEFRARRNSGNEVWELLTIYHYSIAKYESPSSIPVVSAVGRTTVNEGLDGQLLVQYRGRTIPIQEAPPRPGVLRASNGPLRYGPGLDRRVNGVGSHPQGELGIPRRHRGRQRHNPRTYSEYP